MTGTGAGQSEGGVSAESVGMRLNQLPADVTGPTGFGPNLASSPAEKKAAAQAIEDHIEPGTAKAGRWADNDTDAAVKAFGPKGGEGWLTSGALKKAHKTWGDQVRNLMNRLGSDKDALRNTNIVLTGTDFGIGSTVRQSSTLDQY
ncbi:hypothetical protein [Streptomyces griseosporeus]|jgi:hypothetical protein|uniref:hypothetical protein n=1 Tax=Streptomyces griseosporeus TaxID=1910 RepID=UPI0036F79D63